MVAAAFAASAFLISPACAEEPKVTVYGMPMWLADIAERSLTAVLQNIPKSQSPSSVERAMRVVSDRIFTGYRVTAASLDDGDLRVIFEPRSALPDWELEIQYPQLSEPVSGWFASDIAKVDPAINSLVKDLPIEALSWCDEGLRDTINDALKPVLPGWRPGLVVHTEDKRAVLRISFNPELPLILAITPTFSSTSLPNIIYDELKDDLLEQVSVFIGLPVEWANLHAEEINTWIAEVLSDKTLVKNTKSKAAVTLSPAPISRANVRVESSRYTIWGWSAVYAGTTDRSAELGLHLGRKAQLFPHSDMELYGEVIIGLQEGNLEGRLGARWMVWGDVWLGGEYSTKDERWWGRFSIDPRLRKPYAWLRVRDDGEVNTALGWKATEFISFEVHYDSRDSDSWSLRIIGNL